MTQWVLIGASNRVKLPATESLQTHNKTQSQSCLIVHKVALWSTHLRSRKIGTGIHISKTVSPRNVKSKIATCFIVIACRLGKAWIQHHTITHHLTSKISRFRFKGMWRLSKTHSALNAPTTMIKLSSSGQSSSRDARTIFRTLRALLCHLIWYTTLLLKAKW